MAGLMLSFSLPVLFLKSTSSFGGDILRSYPNHPICSRSKPSKVYSDGTSQLHGYLACVLYRGDDTTEQYPFFSPRCTVEHHCVPYYDLNKETDLLKPNVRKDVACGANVMDMVVALKDPESICQLYRDPSKAIDRVCPGVIMSVINQEIAQGRGESYQLPPNPCNLASASFYTGHMFHHNQGPVNSYQSPGSTYQNPGGSYQNPGGSFEALDPE